jgi:hypothetical protein
VPKANESRPFDEMYALALFEAFAIVCGIYAKVDS